MRKPDHAAKGEPRNAKPPRWATNFLKWYCRPRLLEDLEGDLNEYFERNLKSKGASRARLIYIIDVIKFLRPYTLRKINFFTLLSHFMMIGSYLKTSRRSLVRNKLFSLINIIGLAVSMSVGLLVISIINDFNSYDDFQQQKNVMYRVTSTLLNDGQPAMKFASTSIEAGKKIRESVAGIGEVSIMRNGFSGDAKIGEASFPLEAMWADNSFLKIFTFPLVKGDPATALKEPYSLVLTEKAAQRLFGNVDPLGKSVRFDTTHYVLSGVAKDIPRLSHIRFDALISLSTAEIQFPRTDQNFYGWDNIWSNYVYLTLPEKTDLAHVQMALDKLSKQENTTIRNKKINIGLQPVNEIVTGGRLSNNIGTAISPSAVWILGGLALIIILSACFNYTNLSIARSLRRSREVGIRKIIGARKSHVLGQFMAESVVIALLALVFSFVLFLFLREQFLALDPHIPDMVSLEISPRTVLYFIALAALTGLAAGFLPAVFFSRINALLVMKDASNLKMFRRVGIRKALIVIQYTLSLIFIAATLIGYSQYKGLVTFDLGFKTDNILNIRLQGNKGKLLAKELSEIPSVKEVSQSMMINALGSIQGSTMKYQSDSAMVWLNLVDEHYFPVHNHQMLAGKNFMLRPEKGKESEIIVNQQVLKRFNIAKQDPQKALGTIVQVDGQNLEIVGVLKDFHFASLENKIEPVMFHYSADQPYGYLNAKIVSNDLPATLASIKHAWQKIDKVHELDAKFYDDQIEEAYSQYSVLVKIIGFIAFLAICIASLGLFGMVVFTTETKLKEISIRKVLGASETGLIYLLCKGFLLLLVISAVIALPVTYLFFDKVVLASFAYHQPISLTGMVASALVVMVLAFLLIGSQTIKAARNNPANVLKIE